ncbi:hypothetical protein NTGM5_170014 [Candidatus Nitrotoga sp. M5]|nr:hypothetical protein NTGM5_170014 [Candidatus Nitrotoga sp. M5]
MLCPIWLCAVVAQFSKENFQPSHVVDHKRENVAERVSMVHCFVRNDAEYLSLYPSLIQFKIHSSMGIR